MPATSSTLPTRRSPSLRTRLALWAGDAAGWASRVTGRGAGVAISGRVVLRMAPDAVRELATDHRIAIVSGTNGKTTTTRLLASCLEGSGLQVETNATGANLASGLVGALKRADLDGVAVLEVDEAVLPLVIGDLRPEVVVLTNLSRDQLDRFGEVRSVANRWRAALASQPGCRVVANARDPMVVWAAGASRTIWVGAGTCLRADAAACPQCGSLLAWDEERFQCACGFGTPPLGSRLDGSALRIGGEEVEVRLLLPGAWNVVNAAMALTAASEMGIAAADGAAAMARVAMVGNRRMAWVLPDGTPARLFLAKNPAGWTEILRYVAGGTSDVVLAINARIADGRDPSWLYDVPFELLRGRRVVASGERSLDMATRLRYGEISCSIEPDPVRAAMLSGGRDVDICATYTAFTRLLKRLDRG